MIGPSHRNPVLSSARRDSQGRDTGWRTAARIVALAVVYFTAAKIGLQLAHVQPNATAVWPPAGIALAACLVLGSRVWPGIALGAFVANATTAGSLATSAAIATGNTLEAVIGAWLVRRFAHGASALHRPGDLFRFVALGGFASTLVSATIGVTSLALAGFARWPEYGQVWTTWWLGDAMGVLVVAPFLILWGVGGPPDWRRLRTVEAACLGVAFVLTGALFFRGVGVAIAPIAFFWIPVFVWVTYRFGQRAAATAILALSAITVWGTLRGIGPFALSSPNLSLLLLQAFLGVLSTTMLTLAAIETQREIVAAVLRREREHLEERVRERTTEVSRVLESLNAEMGERLRTEEERNRAEAARRGLERELLAVSEAERERVGRDLHDDLAQILTGITFLARSLEGRLSAQSRPEQAAAAEIRGLVAEAVIRTQQLSRGLMPVAVKAEGFVAAMEELAAGVQRVFNVACTFDCPQRPDIENSTAATHLYRIAQEAVTNAVRHGGARSVAIVLSCEHPSTTLVVRDDGAGLDPDSKDGFGFRIMRYRAALLGGDVQIESGAAGTTLTCVFPRGALRAAAQPVDS